MSGQALACGSQPNATSSKSLQAMQGVCGGERAQPGEQLSGQALACGSQPNAAGSNSLRERQVWMGVRGAQAGSRCVDRLSEGCAPPQLQRGAFLPSFRGVSSSPASEGCVPPQLQRGASPPASEGCVPPQSPLPTWCLSAASTRTASATPRVLSSMRVLE